MRIFDELPCGCLISEDGGGALSPCCYPEVGQEETELHKECMRLYFKEHKTVEEIQKLLGAKESNRDGLGAALEFVKKVLGAKSHE